MDEPLFYGRRGDIRRSAFAEQLGIEMTEAADGHAEGQLELAAVHSSKPNVLVAHGGAAYALADTVAGAAVVSVSEGVSPTTGMRTDYLASATGGELHAEADGPAPETASPPPT